MSRLYRRGKPTFPRKEKTLTPKIRKNRIGKGENGLRKKRRSPASEEIANSLLKAARAGSACLPCEQRRHKGKAHHSLGMRWPSCWKKGNPTLNRGSKEGRRGGGAEKENRDVPAQGTLLSGGGENQGPDGVQTKGGRREEKGSRPEGRSAIIIPKKNPHG